MVVALNQYFGAQRQDMKLIHKYMDGFKVQGLNLIIKGKCLHKNRKNIKDHPQKFSKCGNW